MTGQAYKTKKNERGSITIEFLMIIPILAFIMLFLLGLYILEKKHQALMAARFATQYETVYSRPPTPATVGRAVGDPGGRWMLNNSKDDADPTAQGELNGEVRGSDGLNFASVFSGILNFLGGNNKLEYTASSNTFGGIIGKSNLGSVQGKYVVETNTWICEDSDGNKGGSYFSEIIGVIPVIGRFLSNFFNLSCCETYDESKD